VHWRSRSWGGQLYGDAKNEGPPRLDISNGSVRSLKTNPVHARLQGIYMIRTTSKHAASEGLLGLPFSWITVDSGRSDRCQYLLFVRMARCIRLWQIDFRHGLTVRRYRNDSREKGITVHERQYHARGNGRLPANAGDRKPPPEVTLWARLVTIISRWGQ